MQSRHSVRDDAGQLPGGARVAGGEPFEPGDRIPLDGGVGSNCLGREGVRGVHSETKEIARQQEINGLPSPIGPKGEPPCRARDNSVPALDSPLPWINLLVPLIPRHEGERLQYLRYRSRARGPFVRPHLLARTQVGSICVHFRPSIVCPAAEWLYSLAVRSSMATRGPKQHSAKLLSVGLLK